MFTIPPYPAAPHSTPLRPQLSNVAWLSMLMSAFLGLLALGVVLATFYVMRSWSMWITVGRGPAPGLERGPGWGLGPALGARAEAGLQQVTGGSESGLEGCRRRTAGGLPFQLLLQPWCGSTGYASSGYGHQRRAGRPRRPAPRRRAAAASAAGPRAAAGRAAAAARHRVRAARCAGSPPVRAHGVLGGVVLAECAYTCRLPRRLPASGPAPAFAPMPERLPSCRTRALPAASACALAASKARTSATPSGEPSLAASRSASLRPSGCWGPGGALEEEEDELEEQVQAQARDGVRAALMGSAAEARAARRGRDLEQGCGEGAGACWEEEQEVMEQEQEEEEDRASRSSSDSGQCGALAAAVSGMRTPRPPGAHAGETKRTCAICLENYEEGEKVRVHLCVL